MKPTNILPPFNEQKQCAEECGQCKFRENKMWGRKYKVLIKVREGHFGIGCMTMHNGSLFPLRRSYLRYQSVILRRCSPGFFFRKIFHHKLKTWKMFRQTDHTEDHHADGETVDPRRGRPAEMDSDLLMRKFIVQRIEDLRDPLIDGLALIGEPEMIDGDLFGYTLTRMIQTDECREESSTCLWRSRSDGGNRY
jgi:hypothetical protein